MKALFTALLASALAILGSASHLPAFTRGAYLLLADDSVSVRDDSGNWVPSTGDWHPRVGSWASGFNVLFLSFINADMNVPKSFSNFRSSGQVAAGTKIIYSIGGAGYSQQVDKWRQWFGTADKAKALAQNVAANWKSDGIDIDFEQGVGDDWTMTQNLLVFVQELRRIRPDFIITEAVYGYPQVYSESFMVAKSWNPQGQSQNLLDSVGLMVYSQAQSLDWLA
jgi:hypothetical protein